MQTSNNETAQSGKTALVVEGGAMRGVFSTGVLDGFLARQFNPFHFYVGVSAGATNLAAYLAEMHGRNWKIYIELTGRTEFLSFARFLKGGHMMDLDWLWQVTISQMRLDLEKIYRRRKPFLVGMTDIRTGEAVFKETSAADLENVLKASSALPLFYRGFPVIDDLAMTDGGIADPIPIAEAIRRGAHRVMVIRTRPKAVMRKRDISSFFMSWFVSRYPALQYTLRRQAEIYNDAVALLSNPPSGVSIVEVCPPSGFHIGRFTREPRELRKGYELGLQLSTDAISRWAQSSTIQKEDIQ